MAKRAASKPKPSAAPAGGLLAAGKKFPAFKLTLDTGEPVTEAVLKGKTSVIFVYPRANTPGCTQEACDFGAGHGLFTKAGVAVFGMSRDGSKANANFRAKYSLPFPLICDPDETTLTAWGLLREKTMYGKKVMGVVRTTLLIGPDLTIRQIWDAVKIKGHMDAVLAAATAR